MADLEFPLTDVRFAWRGVICRSQPCRGYEWSYVLELVYMISTYLNDQYVDRPFLFDDDAQAKDYLDDQSDKLRNWQEGWNKIDNSRRETIFGKITNKKEHNAVVSATAGRLWWIANNQKSFTRTPAFAQYDPTHQAFDASATWNKAKNAVVTANRFSNEKAVVADEAKMADLFGMNNELKRSSFVLVGPNHEDYILKINDDSKAELMRSPAGRSGSP